MTKKILRYLDGEMNDEEKVKFEKDIAENQELKEKVQLHKDVYYFLLNVNDYEKLKLRIKNVHEQYENEQIRVKKYKYIKILSIAASIILSIGVFSVVETIRSSTVRIYSQNFKVWDYQLVTRSANGNNELMFWINLYSNGKYEEAVHLFDQLPTSNIKNTGNILMYSCSLMELKKYKEAISALESINTVDSDIWEARVSWYKGLCYLQLEDFDKAKKTFSSLINTSKKYSEKAQSICKKIEDK